MTTIKRASRERDGHYIHNMNGNYLKYNHDENDKAKIDLYQKLEVGVCLGRKSQDESQIHLVYHQ